MTDRDDIWALVPVKGFAAAKNRLSSHLAEADRAELARCMMLDVLDVLLACGALFTKVVVVTADEDVAALATAHGVSVMREAEATGINAALAFARDAVGEAAALVVPADIPQLTLAVLEAAAAALRQPGHLVIAEAREDGGTNLLGCRPGRAMPLRFGAGSFLRHCEAAREAGLTVNILSAGEIGLDIDRPDNIGVFLTFSTSTRTHAFLSSRNADAGLRRGV